MCGGHLPLSTTYYRLGAGRRLHIPPATYRLLPTTCYLACYLPPLDDLLLRTYLLEARAAEADARLEELGADARVDADGVRDLVHVGAGDLVRGQARLEGGSSAGELGEGQGSAKGQGQAWE